MAESKTGVVIPTIMTHFVTDSNELPRELFQNAHQDT